MKTTKLILLGIAAFCITSCQQYKKGEGGMLYKIHKDEDGPTLKENDFLSIKVIQKTESDSVMYSSYWFDHPEFMPMQKSTFKGDIFSALSLLSEGDSATFKLSMDSLVKKGMTPPPGGEKFLLYTFKIEKVIPKGKLSDQDFNTQVQAYLAKEREKAKNGEAAKVANYIKEKDYTPVATASGLKYMINQKGAGNLASPGDTVLANYTVYALSGKLFDTSVPDSAKKAITFNAGRKYEPVKFPVGLKQSIAGFDEGLMLFPKGTKARLIVPSSLAYGEAGNNPVGPFSPLIFDVEVLNIIKGKPPVAPAAAAVPPAPVK